MTAVAALRSTYKPIDSWWTVLLVDPVAVHVLRLLTPLRWITPNLVTVAALVAGAGAAVSFSTGSLIAGALLYHLAFMLDCVDGKLARWRGSVSTFGAWLDMALDRVRVLLCAIGLMGGALLATGSATYLYVGLAVVFLDVFRQWNGLQIHTMREGMRRRLAGHTPVEGDDLRARHGRFLQVSGWLARHRIRPHLFSGIEFQMAVFIVGPLTGLLIAVPLVAGAVFVAFELLITYKFWLTIRGYERALALTPPPDAPGDLAFPAQRIDPRQANRRREPAHRAAKRTESSQR